MRKVPVVPKGYLMVLILGHEGLCINVGLLTQSPVANMPYGAGAGQVTAFWRGKNVGNQSHIFVAVKGGSIQSDNPGGFLSSVL